MADKDIDMTRMDAYQTTRTQAGRMTCGVAFPAAMRLSGHSLSLASDIGTLEACLALERSRSAVRTVSGSEGIQSPPAVPYCEFLTVRSPDGGLQAVCRLMRLDRNNPVNPSLKVGGLRPSPLFTALRYTREGILEVGAPTLAEGVDEAKFAGLLWSGVIRYLEWNGFAFVLGFDRLTLEAGEVGRTGDESLLMDAFGVHPDLEIDPKTSGSRVGLSNPTHTEVADPGHKFSRKWPAGLKEALRRGCRLAMEPQVAAATGRVHFTWVASREMLSDGGPGDWHGRQGAAR